MKFKLILIVVVFLTMKANAQYNLLDPFLKETLTTNETTSYFGNSISMSSDGNTIAIGEDHYIGNSGFIEGRVQVFENNSGLWTQKGQDILGLNDLYNTFGSRVELSADGNTLAVLDSQISFTLSPGQTLEDLLGANFSQYFQYIKVFKFENGNWNQVGADFLSGRFSLSEDGNHITVSSGTGWLVYELTGMTWTQVGVEIPELNTLFSEVVSISGDGSILVIGDPNYDDPNSFVNPSAEGRFKVYENIAGNWTQKGNTIVGNDDFEKLGSQVEISADGTTITTTSRPGGSNDFISNYEFSSGAWTLKGSIITQDIGIIEDIELSSNGNEVIVGDDNGVRIFKFNTDWEQVNRTIGVSLDLDFGHGVTMADSGNVFAVGAPSTSTTGNNGFVNIYNANPFTNLLINGSAEIVPVIGNGWTQTSGNTTAIISPADAQHGDNYFYANQSPLAVFYQDVDLTSFESEIDNGDKAFQLSFYVRSFNQNPPDEARAVLEYKDSGDNILQTFDTGYISSINVWQYVAEVMYAPVGSKTVRVTFYQNRNTGTNNDGLIDDIIFTESSSIIIPDINFEQALIDSNIDSNTDIDGQISEEDALSVISLDVSSKAIEDLTGIEGFVNLQSLNISNNAIVDLDLSQNTSLTSVVANNNQLESFNIQNANNTNIATFNALNNPDLFCIKVDDVDYSNTNWSLIDSQTVFRLDCSGIPFAIPDPNFEQALIDQGIDTDGILNGQMFDLDAFGITNLDVSSQNISDLTGIEFFPDLETLIVSNNNVTTLNLNQNSSLISLDASNNNLQSLGIRNGNNQNIPTANFNATNNPNLTCISVDNKQYSTTNWTNVDAQASFAVDCSATNLNNLLFNGSAELAPIETNGWTIVTSGFTSFQTGSGFAFDGTKIFTANDSPFTEIYQEVDVSLDAAAIDAGLKTYRFSVQLRSFGFVNTDENRAVVEYLDNSGNVLDTYDTGLTASVNAWTGFENFTVAPVGTRTIKVSLSAVRTDNSGSNQAYIDDVVLEEVSFIEIPDPNFEQALIDLGIDSDGIINAQMLGSDPIGVTELNVNNQNISDLTGIESFIDLTILVANANNLSNINTASNSLLQTLIINDNDLLNLDTSANTNLVTLEASNNVIANINISGNTNLEFINLSNNSLEGINVTMLPNLEELYITDNFLTNLDVSQNSILQILRCSNNDLESLNLQNGTNTSMTQILASNNVNLTCITVDDPSYSNTNWLNNEPLFNFDSQAFFNATCGDLVPISDPNFEQALIDLNIDSDETVNGLIALNNTAGVTFLDVSSRNIASLQGIEYFTDLEVLIANDNVLSGVMLNQNTELNTLGLTINDITSIDLSNNPNLTSVNIGFNLLDDIDLSNNVLLQNVTLNNNLLEELDVSMLSNLMNLNVASNDLTQLYLDQNTSLSALNASGNNLINLNLQNGNNTAIIDANFDVTNNPNLTCVEVDDVTFSFANWFSIDPQTGYALDCEPSNDDCFEALQLFLGLDFDATTNSATPSGVTPGCEASGLILFDIWFEFEAPSSGSIRVLLNSSNLEVKVALYEDCNATSPLACGTDGLEVNNLNQGQTYYIQAWIEADLGGRSQSTLVGDFNIEVVDSAILSIGDDSIDNGLNIFPNPASAHVNIQSNNILEDVVVFDVSGKQIISVSAINNQNYKLNTSSLSKGLYMLQIQSENAIINKKLLIK